MELVSQRSRADVIAEQLMSQIPHPHPTSPSADRQVTILVAGGGVNALISALQRRGVPATRGTLAELSGCRVYAEQEADHAAAWLNRWPRRDARVLRVAM